MALVSGKDLLKLIKQNPGKTAKQLAEMAGYTTVTKTGQQRVKMLAFQSAVLSANNIAIRPEEEEAESVRGGRKASYRIQVQQNGNLLIGSAYTRQMGLVPGTEFEIQIGRKHIKLVQVGGGLLGEDSGETTDSKELMAV